MLIKLSLIYLLIIGIIKINGGFYVVKKFNRNIWRSILRNLILNLIFVVYYRREGRGGEKFINF